MNKPAPSVQTDRFVHDRLPPADQWPQLRYDLPELQIQAQANLVDVLFERAEERGLSDRPFLRSDKITLSYRDAHDRVRRIAQVLTDDLQLVPGNRVLLRGGNTVGMALAWLGVVKAGLVAVATMPLLRAKELGEIIVKSQAAVALCDASLLAELQSAQALNPTLASIVSFNLNEPGSLAVRAAAKDGQFSPCKTSADDIAMMAFTSGTTGTPKAAVHTHRDVLAACEAWPRHVLKAVPEDIVMGSPPLAFTFGLGGMLVFPMWAGASVYYPSIAYTPEAMVKLINEVGATIFNGQPWTTVTKDTGAVK